MSCSYINSRELPSPVNVLGKLCLAYVNWVDSKIDVDFVEMTANAESGQRVAAPRGIVLAPLNRAGGTQGLVHVHNAAYVGAPDYRKAGTVQAAALSAADGFDPSLIWLAFAERQPVGYVMSRLFGTSGRVVGLAVLPDYRRRGIGTYMMSHAMRELWSRGAETVRLEVARSEEGPQSLYRGLGFTADRMWGAKSGRHRGRAAHQTEQTSTMCVAAC